MREGQYEYIHEFKERINEITDLQKKLHKIIDKNEHSSQIQLSAIAELRKLSITLSNLFDVAPLIVNGITVLAPSQSTTTTAERSATETAPTQYVV